MSPGLPGAVFLISLGFTVALFGGIQCKKERGYLLGLAAEVSRLVML